MARKLTGNQESLNFLKQQNEELRASLSVAEKQLENERAKNKQFQQELLSQTLFPVENPNPVLRLSTQGEILYANDASAGILNTWDCQVGEQAPAEIVQIVEATFEERRPQELEIASQQRVYSFIIVPIVASGYTNLYGRDITERNQAQTALSQSEQKFARAFQNNPAALTITRVADMRYTDVNESFCKLVGYKREEIIGRSSIELGLFTQEERAGILRQFTQAGSIHQKEFNIRRKDGNVCQILFSLDPIEADGEPAILATIIDISERMKAEQRLRQVNEELELRVQERTLDLQSALEELEIADEELKVQNEMLETANERLKESETRLNQTLNRAPVMMWVMDREGKITFAAGRDFDKIGLKASQLPGRSVYEWVRQRPELMIYLQQALAGEEVVEIVPSQITPGQYFDTHYLPDIDDKGQIRGVMMVATNISDQVRTMGELRLANGLMETVFASVDMMIAYLDRDFNFLKVNEAYAQADDHDPEYYVGKNHFGLFPNEENRAIFQQVIDTGKPYVVYEKPFEYQYALGRGVSYWDWSLQPVKDAEGSVQGLVLSLVNVTERVKADQAYHKGLERGSIMAEFSTVIARVGTDYQAVLDTITQKIAELLKGSCAIRLVSEDKQTLELASFCHPDPDTHQAFYHLISSYAQPVGEGFAGQVFQTGEKLLVSKMEFDQVQKSYSSEYSGYLQQLNINSAIAMPLRFHGKAAGVLIVYRCPPEEPLTEWELEIMQPAADRAALAINNAALYRDLQKTLELEQNMRIQLIQSEKYAALARLVASVAHELNNPIQTIKNCLYLIQNKIPADQPSRQFIDMAVSEGTRVSNLVAQLRETYRPAKDTAKPFNLIELLESYQILISPHVQQNHVNLSIRYPELPGDCMVNGIADQIKQVLINIGLNAIEAMQPDGGDLVIELSTPADEKCVQISIVDTGPGIEPKHLNQLFEPFFTTKPKGTGLGLSICYEIIQAHGGKITVESVLGKGTTFKICLPV